MAPTIHSNTVANVSTVATQPERTETWAMDAQWLNNRIAILEAERRTYARQHRAVMVELCDQSIAAYRRAGGDDP